MRRLLPTILTVAVIGLLCLVAGGLLLLKTPLLRSDLTRALEASLGDAVGGTVRMDPLRGDLTQGATIHNLTITLPSGWSITADTALVEYDAILLLRKVASLDRFAAHGVRIAKTPRTGEDNTARGDSVPAGTGSAQPSSNWSVECRSILIYRGEISIPIGDTLLAVRDISADASYVGNTLILNQLFCRSDSNSTARLKGTVDLVGRLNVDVTIGPTLLRPADLRSLVPSLGRGVAELSLQASVTGTPDSLRVRARLSNGGKDSLLVRGMVGIVGSDSRYDLDIAGSDVNPALLSGYDGLTGLVHFAATIRGSGFTPGGSNVSASVKLDRSRLGPVWADSADLSLSLGKGSLQCGGLIHGAGGKTDFTANLGVSVADSDYSVEARLSNIDLGAFLPELGLPSTDLNGQVRLLGRGSALKGEIKIIPSRMASATIVSASLPFSIDGPNLKLTDARVIASDGAVRASLSTDLSRLPSKADLPGLLHLGLRMEANLDSVEIARYLGITGNVTGSVAVTTDDGEAVVAFHGGPSMLAGISLSRSDLDLTIDKDGASLSRGLALTALGELAMSGHLDLRTRSTNLSYMLTSTDSISLEPYLSAGVSGLALSGLVAGSLDSLDLLAQIRLDSLRNSRVFVRGGTLDLAASRLNWASLGKVPSLLAQCSGTLKLSADSLAVLNRPVGPFSGEATASSGKATLVLNAGNSRSLLSGKLLASATTNAFPAISARVESLKVSLAGSRWSNDRPARIERDESGQIAVRDAGLSHDGTSIQADGILDSSGTADISVAVTSIELAELAKAAGLSDTLTGTADAAGVLTGPIYDPVIIAKIDVKDGRVSRFDFGRLAGDVRYSSGTVDIDCLLLPDSRQSLTVQGAVPLHRFTTGDMRDLPLFLKISSDSLDISWAPLLLPGVADVKGKLQIDLSVDGTIGDPNPSGDIRLTDCRLRIPDLGLSVVDASARLKVTPDSLQLAMLRLVDDSGGEFRLSGAAGLKGLQVTGMDGRATLDRFKIIDLRETMGIVRGTEETRGVIKGSLQIGGTPSEPALEGSVVILRAEMPLPEATEPGTRPPETSLDTFLRSPFVRRFSAAIRVDMPRNLWVRSVDVNSEVQGNLNITKAAGSPILVFFGSLQSIRGWYLYQGRSFAIDRGEMTFQGTERFDPEISFIGTHRLAGGATGEPIPVQIIVGGTLERPQITLEASDPETNEPMNEIDIMAYLLFGRPANLTATETVALESRAKGLLMGLAASRLKQSIADQFGLDVIEIEEGTTGRAGDTRVRLGKYVSQDLFVSYSQLLSTSSLRQVDLARLRENAEVRVEYEINSHLNVEGSMDAQLRTGLDLLWKHEW